jgi:hypothetical protein
MRHLLCRTPDASAVASLPTSVEPPTSPGLLVAGASITELLAEEKVGDPNGIRTVLKGVIVELRVTG